MPVNQGITSALGPLVAIVIAGVVGAVAVFLAPERRHRLALRRAKRLRIRDVTEGQIVRLTGRVRCIGEPLIAPLSGRRCAEYRVLVTGAESGNSDPMVDERVQVDFLIEDETGRARVTMRDAAVDVAMDARYWSSPMNDADKKLESFLVARGKSSRGLIFNKDLVYKEGAIEVGERVTVLGLARREPDNDPGALADSGVYRDAPTRVVLVPPPGGRLLVSDDSSL